MTVRLVQDGEGWSYQDDAMPAFLRTARRGTPEWDQMLLVQARAKVANGGVDLPITNAKGEFQWGNYLQPLNPQQEAAAQQSASANGARINTQSDAFEKSEQNSLLSKYDFLGPLAVMAAPAAVALAGPAAAAGGAAAGAGGGAAMAGGGAFGLGETALGLGGAAAGAGGAAAGTAGGLMTLEGGSSALGGIGADTLGTGALNGSVMATAPAVGGAPVGGLAGMLGLSPEMATLLQGAGYANTGLSLASRLGGDSDSTDMTGFTGNGSNFGGGSPIYGSADPYGSLGGLNFGSSSDPYGLGWTNADTGYANWDQMLNNGSLNNVNMSTADPGVLAKLASALGTNPANLLKMAGTGVGGILGALGASKQADNLAKLAEDYKAMGAPSRARYESTFAPGFTMANDPGYTDALNASSKASMHALSVNGNPAGSPNAWAATEKDLYDKTAYPALQNYRSQNAATGGIQNFNAAVPDTTAASLGAGANVFNSLGKTAANIFAPSQPTSLADLMKLYQQQGNSGGSAIFGNTV